MSISMTDGKHAVYHVSSAIRRFVVCPRVPACIRATTGIRDVFVKVLNVVVVPERHGMRWVEAQLGYRLTPRTTARAIRQAAAARGNTYGCIKVASSHGRLRGLLGI
jgi:hypothetical protein